MTQFGKMILLLAALSFSSVCLAHGEGVAEAPAQHFSGTDSLPAKVVLQFHRALQNSDVAAARALLAENVMIFESGQVERSAAEYAAHHLLADMRYLKNLTVTLLEHHVTVEGELAISSSVSQLQGQLDDKVVNRKAMETMVLKRIQGLWQIVSIHWS